ncbi:MAG TPA: hypothetical protein DDZ88_01865 [Verrucomicrobiales bacterium]|nr:hypothetical protein [Verrucomicrobiales bacterium]
MSVIDEIVKLAQGAGGILSEKKGVHTLEILVAERKAFLSRKKLTYLAKFRVDDASKELRFTEMLKESGFGISSGDSGLSPGFGFKKESYSTGFGKPREGTIEEQSSLFGKQYRYTFDFGRMRSAFETIAQAHGYAFKYQVIPIGL